VRATLHSGFAFASIAVAISGCGGDDPPLSDATSLQCPFPGDLPFRLESRGFQKDANEERATSDPRVKDEASDVVGSTDSTHATVYVPDDQNLDAAPVRYAGVKARTKPDQGLFSRPLGGENVSLWFYDPIALAWNMVDRGTTDANGVYSFTAGGFVPPPAAPVYAVLEADGSCATHYTYLASSGSKFVVMDIDGTLTSDDQQIILQVSDEAYVPQAMIGASALAKAWAAKGYRIVYLTARAHVFDTETRAWLDMLEFPKGPIITTNGGASADVYKTTWLRRLITGLGWTPYAAYGNAPTDITAYANVGIPLARTFIIGPEAGNGGTVAIPNNDYTQHIAGFVNAQPNNQ
jgi:hypothetical protein